MIKYYEGALVTIKDSIESIPEDIYEQIINNII